MRYRLADAKHRVPMPDRAGVFFTADKAGEVIDPMNPYYARMIADGDVVPVEDEPERAEPSPATPAPTRNSKTEGSK